MRADILRWRPLALCFLWLQMSLFAATLVQQTKSVSLSSTEGIPSSEKDIVNVQVTNSQAGLVKPVNTSTLMSGVLSWSSPIISEQNTDTATQLDNLEVSSSHKLDTRQALGTNKWRNYLWAVFSPTIAKPNPHSAVQKKNQEPLTEKRFLRGFRSDLEPMAVSFDPEPLFQDFSNSEERFVPGLEEGQGSELEMLSDKRFMRDFPASDEMDALSQDKRFIKGLNNYFKKDATDKRFMRGFRSADLNDMSSYSDNNDKRFMRGFRSFIVYPFDGELDEHLISDLSSDTMAAADKRFIRGLHKKFIQNYDKRFIKGFHNYGKRFMRGYFKRAVDVEPGSSGSNGAEKRFLRGFRAVPSDIQEDKRFMKGFARYSKRFIPEDVSPDLTNAENYEDGKRFIKGYVKKDASSSQMDEDKRFMKGFGKKDDISSELDDKRFMRGYMKKSQENDADKRFIKGLYKKSDEDSVTYDKRFMQGYIKKADDETGAEEEKRFIKGLVKKDNNAEESGDNEKRFMRGFKRSEDGRLDTATNEKRFMKGFNLYDKKDIGQEIVDEAKRFMKGFHVYAKKDNELTNDVLSGMENKRFMRGYTKKEADKRFIKGLIKKEDDTDKRFIKGLIKKEDDTDKRFIKGLVKKEDEADKRFIKGLIKKEDDADKRFIKGFSKKEDEADKRFIKGLIKKEDEADKRFIKGFTKKEDEADKRFIKGLIKKEDEADKRFIKGFTKKEDDADKRFIKGLIKKEDEEKGFMKEEEDNGVTEDLPVAEGYINTHLDDDISDKDKRFMRGFGKRDKAQSSEDKRFMRGFGKRDKVQSSEDKRFIKGLEKFSKRDANEKGFNGERKKRAIRFNDDSDADLIQDLISQEDVEDYEEPLENVDSMWHDDPVLHSLVSSALLPVTGYPRQEPFLEYDMDASDGQVDVSKRFVKGLLKYYNTRQSTTPKRLSLDTEKTWASDPFMEKRFMRGYYKKADLIDAVDKGIELYAHPQADKRFMRGFEQYGRRTSQIPALEEKRFLPGFAMKPYDKRFLSRDHRLILNDGQNPVKIPSFIRPEEESPYSHDRGAEFGPKRDLNRLSSLPSSLPGIGSRRFLAWINGQYIQG